MHRKILLCRFYICVERFDYMVANRKSKNPCSIIHVLFSLFGLEITAEILVWPIIQVSMAVPEFVLDTEFP